MSLSVCHRETHFFLGFNRLALQDPVLSNAYWWKKCWWRIALQEASDRPTMSITWESFRHYGVIVTALLQVSSLLSWIIGREDNRDALQDKEKMDNLSKWIILGTAEQTHSSASIKNRVQVSLLTRWQSQVCHCILSLAIAWFSEVPTQQADYTSCHLSLSSAHHSCPALWWKTFPCNGWNGGNYFQCYLTWEEVNKNTQPGV